MSTPSGPTPASLAARSAQQNAPAGDPADHPVAAEVRDLLEEAAMIGSVVGEEFDLGAVSRQTQLLSKAHDALANALEDAR
ncbi:hypothetical protein nbrc107696_36280 [Gordonia spumicola]|uniref:Uncharacterized protein n=1 Tax=Gordonia spumicola TaxID=589161 RepID=A0A7I9VD98_9ACTN|nr:hypothetical protein [Gordonia spumicola]GEE03182.1 hypothetical protein nbrc107696_36280 [Gordonia spumicola]